MNEYFTRKNLKQAANDLIVTIPYVVVDTILYLSTALEFLNFVFSQNDSDENRWGKPQYIILLIASVILGISYFCTFSSTNGKVLKVNNDNIYSRGKEIVRRALGIPSAIIKTSIGASSFYMFLRERIENPYPWVLSGVSLFCGLPAMMALLWSKHRSELEENPLLDNKINNRRRFLKYMFIYLTTLFYAIDNTSIYFWGTLNLPKKLGYLDHDLSNYKNPTEQFFYYFSYLVAAFPFVAVYIAYSHLNENMFNLVANENSKWTCVKEKVKKVAGPIGAVTKIVNAGVSSYGFFSKRISPTSSIIISSAGCLSGLLTQYSILAFDPIEKNKFDDTTVIEKQIESQLLVDENEDKEDKEVDRDEVMLVSTSMNK